MMLEQRSGSLLSHCQAGVPGETAAREKFLVLRVEDALLLRVNRDQNAVGRSTGRRFERARPFECRGIRFEALLHRLNGVVQWPHASVPCPRKPAPPGRRDDQTDKPPV